MQSKAQAMVGELRDLFVSWPTHAIASVMSAVSHNILSQHMSGRLWGSEGRSDNVTRPHRDVFQCVHRALQEKVAQHDVLTQLLLEAVSACV